MWLKRLADSRREPPGLEWTVIRKLPGLLMAGTLIPIIFALAGHWFPPQLAGKALEQHLTMINILSVAVVVAVWVAVFTIAIGCFIVLVMKGPAYVADAYEMKDADQPRRDDRRI